MIKCTILGCGGSMGVPQVACSCYVCKSTNPKNIRTRASLLIESDNCKILIDASPDLRFHALKHNITHLDAVIFTHAHSDHFSGLDELKPIYLAHNFQPIPTYATAKTYADIKKGFDYAFSGNTEIYKPFVTENIVGEYDVLKIKDIELQLFAQEHGKGLTVLGIKVNNFVYSTDVNNFSDKSKKYLENLDTWVVDCLRYHFAPTHSSYEQVMDWVDQYKPKQVYFTHMAHEIEYDEINRITPDNISPAHDGLVIEVK